MASRIPWRRELADMYSFEVTIPQGVSSIDIALDYIAAPESSGFSSAGSTTDKLAILSWNQMLLYPKGTLPDQLNYQADLKVPAGWRYGTALPIETESGQKIQFKPSSLTTLIDSPVLMGTYFRTIDLTPGSTPPHYLHIAADSERATEASPDEVTHLQNLVKETGALFGARHYRDYHFLLALSDHVAHSRPASITSRAMIRSMERYPRRRQPAPRRRRSAVARDVSFVEREVSPTGRSGHAGLQRADEG